MKSCVKVSEEGATSLTTGSAPVPASPPVVSPPVEVPPVPVSSDHSAAEHYIVPGLRTRQNNDPEKRERH